MPLPGFYYVISHRWSGVIEGQFYIDLAVAKFWLSRIKPQSDYHILRIQVIGDPVTIPPQDTHDRHSTTPLRSRL